MKINNKQSGVTLLLSILVLSSILAISFSIATILLVEVRTSGDLLRTEEALYGAEGVAEEALYGIRHNIATYKPGSNAYSTNTSNNKVSMTSTSSLLSDAQVNDVIPLPSGSDYFNQGKRYELYDAADTSAQASGYGKIKVTYLSTNNSGQLVIYVCQYNSYSTYATPYCSNPDSSEYWLGLSVTLNQGESHTWTLDPARQQVLILANKKVDASSGDIHVLIEPFGSDYATPKGLPHVNETTVDVNATNNGVNRRIRTTIPNY